MLTALRLRETLGGYRVLKGVGNFQDLSQRVKEGLPYLALEAMAARLGIPLGELTAILGLPPRTLARRKRSKRLSSEESDRLVRLGRVVALAEDILGDRERATRWLQRPNRALGQRVPLTCLDTDLGARSVEEVLQRLAHGVYS